MWSRLKNAVSDYSESILHRAIMYIWNFIFTASLLTSTQAVSTPFCKRNPTSSQWPSAQQWQALNESVAGMLQVPVAPGAACHSDQLAFNNDTCLEIQANWTSTDWVAQNPQLSDYNDETCLPSVTAPCSTAGYPAYVIEAYAADHVAAGVKFAKENQVRLVVKGTGHDFPGRSSGPGSLSIWTHKLQGIKVLMNDSKAVQYGGVAAMKISAGMRMGQIYTEAAENNLTIVGGADPHVGIGGYITGGGHSPVSAKYGMAADQVLEMEVVTADGQLLTVNEDQNDDLFWAIRGGGGSTFAVLLSVTIKTYASLPATMYTFSYNTTSDSDTFWSAVGHFHADLPRLSKAGGMGYYYIIPTGASPDGPEGKIYGIWIFPELDEDEVKAIMNPLEQMLSNSPSWATDKIDTGGNTISVPDFTKAFLVYFSPQNAGVPVRLGSWLFDGPSLTSDANKTAVHFRKATPKPWSLLGHLVAGAGTHNVTIPGGSSAILPAWREAYAHVIAVRSWEPLNTTQKNEVTRSLRDDIVPALKSLAPKSGAYINEADPTNPEWKNDYFGSHYERLLEIKKKWDPEDVFWCKPCVGHDEWEVMNGPEQEDQENWGMAQVGGDICRKEV